VAPRKRSTPTAKPKGSVAQARGVKSPAPGRHWESFKSLAALLAIFFAIRIFVIEAYRIPSGSMVPSLLVGDWLFVNKFIYGPSLPYTTKPIRVRIPGTPIRFYRDPRRGDIVVFQSPPQIDQPEDPTPTLVKRLIGMPGDTIYMRKGLVYVNGMPQRQGYGAHEPPPPGAAESYDPLFDWQHKFELKGTRFGAPPARPAHDEWGPLLIPENRYMMMGDNRYNSKDSRYWGFVPRNNVRGQPIFVYYSYDPECGSGVCPLTDIRWSRIGHLIR
jgi:signal peptidase I